MNTIEKKYDLINNFEQFSKLKVKLEKVDKYIYYEIMKKYFERKYNDIDALDKGQKNELRLKLVKLFKDKVTFFKEMFLNENDLVTIEEMRNINDLTIIYEITNENKINDVYIKECMKYNKYNSKSFIIKFLKNMSNNKSINNEWYKLIYESINYQKYNFTEQEWKRLFNISKVKLGLDNLENFRKYILKTNYYANFLDVHYISLIDSNASEQIKDYIYICKKYNFVSDEGIDKINDCNTYNILNEQMRERMFDRKHYYTYIVSTILEKGIFAIEEEKFNQLKEYYVKHFIANKECNYKIGENMKLFLYENVNMTDLNKEQLKRFITLSQKKRNNLCCNRYR